MLFVIVSGKGGVWRIGKGNANSGSCNALRTESRICEQWVSCGLRDAEHEDSLLPDPLVIITVVMLQVAQNSSQLKFPSTIVGLSKVPSMNCAS